MARWSRFVPAIPSAATWPSTRSIPIAASCPRKRGPSSSSSPTRSVRSRIGIVRPDLPSRESRPVPLSNGCAKRQNMSSAADLAKASLDDKYTLERGRVFLTGTQALIRLMLLQRERDARSGLNTAGFVSGYRGSPLGGLDQALWRAQKHLESHHVKFQPGVNEDLAATAIWGTQQVNLFPGAKYDGVYAMWYGKGPGVDRCGDVFKHANAAGTSRHGGVLVLAGDDHAAKSSTLPHQSEHIFKACLIPVLNPANVQDYLDLGVHGFAMSRYSGCWIAFKCVTDVVESGASVVVDPERISIRIPADFTLPPDGLNIRWPDGILEQEARILDWKVYAALAYARANELDKIVWNTSKPKLGIITSGKSFGDVMQGLADLGIDERVARAIAQRMEKLGLTRDLGSQFRERLAFLDFKEKLLSKPRVTAIRQPYFCSGCPHNTSTRVPEGSRATAGIGCHFMAVWMDRSTATFTHMGAEGAPWIGQAPFTNEKHIFANLGDGTYFHSGLLAIRAAVAAKVAMTYKILYNDAVAMTGGQRHDGPLDPAIISRQLAAEGVKPIVIVTDEPQKYPAGTDWAPGVTIRHRDELDRVQRELREMPGVSALIYDQTCASEKRRRRKRNAYPDPAVRAVINERVCEGCGGCSVKSNCLSVEPLETEFGRKRVINQSSCNKDYSCLKGFCPSFVTVEGGRLRKGKSASKAVDDFPALSEPALPQLAAPYGVLVTGIGGTGVITIGQILAMAAHLEAKGVSVLDMSGLAQKYGAVMSHVQLAPNPGALSATRIDTGGASLVIGCDLVVSASTDAIAKMAPGQTRAVINASVTPTAEFVRNPNWQLPGSDLQHDIEEACGRGNASFITATQLATGLMGDAIATNMLMLGYAYQKGWLPVSGASLERAIELNGVAVEFNQQSFLWGRRAAVDLERVARIAQPAEVIALGEHFSRSLDELVERRVKFLTGYQDAPYAERYRTLVERVRQRERDVAGSTKLTEAVARYYAKLLAYKDEYEVARLHADGALEQKIAGMFEGDYKRVFHLAPPLFARKDPTTGEPRKMRFGAWMLPVFRLLKTLRGLRGTALDPFGYTAERRTERALIAQYEGDIERLLAKLSSANHSLAVQIASVPEDIRGFGHVKTRHLAAARKKHDELFARFDNLGAERAAA